MIHGGSRLVGHALARRLRATAAQALVERDHASRSHILSVGLPIRTLGGDGVDRGAVVVVRGDAGEPRAAKSESDIDWTAIGAADTIEPARLATWVFRFEDRGERIKR